MLDTDLRAKKFAIGLAFLVPGALCGLMTARLPALTLQAGLDTTDVGLILFIFGSTCCVSLLMVDLYLKRFSSFWLLCTMTPVCVIAISALGFSHGKVGLYIAAIVLGHAISLVDVAMNTQGMLFEARSKSAAMSFFHAYYGMGAILACVFAALFSHFNVSVGINLFVVSVGFEIVFFSKARHLYREDGVGSQEDAEGRPRIAREATHTIIVIGIMVLLMYCAEGIVTDWGSLFMVREKGSPESLAAMTYGVFSCTSVALSFFGDPIRERYGDFTVMATSVAIATLGMLIVIFAPEAYGTLFGYAVSGLGLALMVPILFSLAGHTPGVDAQYASARVSIYAYTGILFFPPLVGFTAKWIGLRDAMSIVFAMFAVFVVCLLWLHQRPFNKEGRTPSARGRLYR